MQSLLPSRSYSLVAVVIVCLAFTVEAAKPAPKKAAPKKVTTIPTTIPTTSASTTASDTNSDALRTTTIAPTTKPPAKAKAAAKGAAKVPAKTADKPSAKGANVTATTSSPAGLPAKTADKPPAKGANVTAATSSPAGLPAKNSTKDKPAGKVPATVAPAKGAGKAAGSAPAAPSYTSTDSDADIEVPSTLDETTAAQFVLDVQGKENAECFKKVSNEWNYVTNITRANEKLSVAAGKAYADFRKAYWTKFMAFPWRSFKNESLRRIFYLESMIGSNGLSPEKMANYSAIIEEMKKQYSTAQVCDFKVKDKCDLRLEPQLQERLGTSKDPEELKYIWTQFHDKVGTNVKELFNGYVNLSNEAAVVTGYHDMGELWQKPFESDFLPLEMWAFWGELRPLYEQLHAYARKRLRDAYANETTTTGCIPAHILGNMWGQSWAGIYERYLTPFKTTKKLDVTPEMKKQGFTVKQIYEKADKFFQSLGLDPMLDTFWNNSMLEKPKGREVVCHSEAWEFCHKNDFRIKFCTTVTMKDLITSHHEMTHIQYYMNYKDQSVTFRDGANPAFHEAIGDTVSLLVSSSAYLKSLGLIPADHEETFEEKINFLMSQALRSVVQLPFELVVEQWRWDVFNGKVKPQEYNCHWWKLKTQVQGVKPPQKRSPTNFDPGAKYHTVASIPYDRYFMATILTYDFHEALCKTAGQYDPADPTKPLYNCNIFDNKEAGAKLKAMLQSGASKPWPVALDMLTGSRHVSARPMYNYYEPLLKWLKEENAKTKEYIGWDDVNFGTKEFCGE